MLPFEILKQNLLGELTVFLLDQLYTEYQNRPNDFPNYMYSDYMQIKNLTLAYKCITKTKNLIDAILDKQRMAKDMSSRNEEEN